MDQLSFESIGQSQQATDAGSTTSGRKSKGSSAKLSKAQRLALVSDYRNVVPIAEIKRRYGVSEPTIYRVLAGQGLEPSRKPQRNKKEMPRKLQPHQIGAVKTLLELGVNKSKIARTVGISRQSVYRIADDLNAAKPYQPAFLPKSEGWKLQDMPQPPAQPGLIRRFINWLGF